ncbi:MAG: accessory gene regulator B family protein [Lachnospiraceae bacterium]|nr:accessory gene regulator B family protein [Lachnospiraceae bacterium]
MIAKMALKLVNRMEAEKMIGKNEKVYYEYALITMAERIITIGTVLSVGMVFRQVIPTVCFLVFFLLLRKRTGGYHADKFWQCYFMTIITYITVMQVSLLLFENPIVMYVMLFFSVIIIGVIGTVNHPNVGMDRRELQEAKKVARLCVFIETLIIALLIALDIDDLYVCYMSLAIILCATLLCVAKIAKQEVKL